MGRTKMEPVSCCGVCGKIFKDAMTNSNRRRHVKGCEQKKAVNSNFLGDKNQKAVLAAVYQLQQKMMEGFAKATRERETMKEAIRQNTKAVKNLRTDFDEYKRSHGKKMVSILKRARAERTVRKYFTDKTPDFDKLILKKSRYLGGALSRFGARVGEFISIRKLYKVDCCKERSGALATMIYCYLKDSIHFTSNGHSWAKIDGQQCYFDTPRDMWNEKYDETKPTFGQTVIIQLCE